MKKLLAACMILMLSFSMFACGAKTPATDSDMPNQTEDQEQVGEDGAEIEVPDTIIPDGFADDGEEDEDASAAFDFGFTAKKSFGMSGSVKKLNNSKIASEGDNLASQFQKALDASTLGSFDAGSSDYDEYDGETIDKQLYALAMRNDVGADEIDTAAIAEAGFYHSSEEKNYHQYTSYISESFSKVSKSLISSELKKIEKEYGIKVSASKIEKAMQAVFDKVKETEYEYSLCEKKTMQGDGYTEVITLSVDGAMYEDDSLVAYIYVDRDRVYK